MQHPHQTIFILGRQSELSVAEIESVLKQTRTDFKIVHKSNEALIVQTKEQLAHTRLMQILGGTIKIGDVLEKIPKLESENIIDILIKHMQNKTGKVYFGLSAYGAPLQKQTLMECKRVLKEKRIRANFIIGENGKLSSAQVKNLNILQKGVELLFISSKNYFFVGRTTQVQPFDEFSERDYGRPHRNARKGMLPPKLARIMLNLSGAKKYDTILDPFCGSGTILGEAALLGYKNIIGSDINKNALEATRKNLQWMLKDSAKNIKLIQADATKLYQKISAHSIDIIVTEPYLGPPLKGNETQNKISQISTELKTLYTNTLKSFNKILKPKAILIFIVPDFVSLNFHQLGFTLIKTFVYKRPNQYLARQILVLKPTI